MHGPLLARKRVFANHLHLDPAESKTVCLREPIEPALLHDPCIRDEPDALRSNHRGGNPDCRWDNIRSKARQLMRVSICSQVSVASARQRRGRVGCSLTCSRDCGALMARRLGETYWIMDALDHETCSRIRARCKMGRVCAITWSMAYSFPYTSGFISAWQHAKSSHHVWIGNDHRDTLWGDLKRAESFSY